MLAKLTRCFTDSAAALLAAFATALFIGNVASAGLVPPHDPVFDLSMRLLFWILCAGAIAVVLVSISVRRPPFQLALIFCFAFDVISYALRIQWQGHNLGGYLGGMANAFDLSAGFVNHSISLFYLYLFFASGALLLCNFLAKPEEIPLKMTCYQCGGHVAFSARNLGQKIACPHCETSITLRRPENLKMSCFFCHEHIEFPVHAIGEKIICPHCKMDISLKEPA